MVLLTAENKQSPQQICPQGVNVAYVGGEKQMGQLYEARGSNGLWPAGAIVHEGCNTGEHKSMGELGGGAATPCSKDGGEREEGTMGDRSSSTSMTSELLRDIMVLRRNWLGPAEPSSSTT
jgi:hypothetical protein